MASPPQGVRTIPSHSVVLPRLERSILLYGVFFLICLGLGYPTLNRYDPRKLIPDAGTYSKLATDGPGAVTGHFRFRVLEPWLARPLYRLADGHVGSWDPLLLAFLGVNSCFVAGTALLITRIGYAHLGDYPRALAGAALYLLNFATPNLLLSGLIDSAESFFLLAMVLSLYFERPWLLPLFGVLGAFTKESFVPFSVAIAGTWWLVASNSGQRRRRALLWTIVMALFELLSLMLLQFSIAGQLIWPWNFAQALNSHADHVTKFFYALVDHNNWYILIWLLPLGLLRIRRFPRPWVAACAGASVTAWLLSAYHGGSPGGGGRYIFNIAGPLLSLSAAVFLCDLGRERIQPPA